MSWGAFTYMHTILNVQIHIYKPFFKNRPNFPILCVNVPMDLVSGVPKFFSQKNFMRTFVMTWRTFTYTHTIFLMPISEFTSFLLRITPISQFFVRFPLI